MLQSIQPQLNGKALAARRLGRDMLEILVEPDGSYRIAINGAVIPCFRWGSSQLGSCVRALNTMAGDAAPRKG